MAVTETKYWPNGNIRTTQEYWNGRWDDVFFLNPEVKPSFQSFHENGTLFREEWITNDILHRIDGPALIDNNEDGTIDYTYMVMGDQVYPELLGIPNDYSKWTDIEKDMFMLHMIARIS